MCTKSISKFFSSVILLTGLALGSAQAQKFVPYKGSAVGKVITREDLNGGVAIPGGAPFRHVVSQAVGNFTHLGKATAILDEQVRLILEDGVPFLILDGTYTVTAANGDTIFGTFQNKQNYITNGFTTETSVEGGTGRFAGATGLMTGTGQFYADTDTFDYSLEGVISSVGSSK